ncbi:NUDIX domain-containing protein [Streptomyces sp. NPDC001941]|uniref:NUDIX hydrolase n=1 Tax=Streptomyces sp. NPDC001941 TaxID=3154659 RepID=UPI0033284D68
MPPSHSGLRKTVEAYLARHPDERDALTELLDTLDGPDPDTLDGSNLDALDGPDTAARRTTPPARITCSAVVIDRTHRVLHSTHPGPDGHPQVPGGCPEPGDRSLLATALRRLSAATGIPPGALCLTPQYLGAPLDIDVRDVEASPGTEQAHHSYDFRFAFYLADDPSTDPAPGVREARHAQWLAFTDVPSPSLRKKLLSSGVDGRPEPVNASVLVHDGAGSYLVHLRDDLDHVWAPWTLALLGGGRKHEDRDLEDTLRRELAEEVPDLRLATLAPYAVEDAVSVDGLRVPIQVFSALWHGRAEQLAVREGVLLHWIALDQLDRVRLSPGLGDLIRRHAAEHPPATSDDDSPLRVKPDAYAVLNGIGVHLHLQDDQGRVLLGLRHPDSSYAGDMWHFLAGRCEQESAVTCLVREAREEAGLVIDPADVTLVHVTHLVDRPGGRPLLQMVFQAHRWQGVPHVREPDKCLAWGWWSPTDLPSRLVPYARTALEGIAAGRAYSELGW